MNRFRLSSRAELDIHGIWDYIGVVNGNPSAAYRQVEALIERFDVLGKHPLLGELREDLRPNLRLFAVDNYVILYYPIEGGIEVAGVVHGAQDFEAMFREGRR